VRWAIGVFLTGFGITNFTLPIMLMQFCNRTEVSVPDAANGIVYPFSDRGRILYVSLLDRSAILLLRISAFRYYSLQV
jgi:hypothetical protein